jgi:hypothetical protein
VIAMGVLLAGWLRRSRPRGAAAAASDRSGSAASGIDRWTPGVSPMEPSVLA